MATIVVMYTLMRSEDGTLEGPINKKVYASYAPKRHAMARREANKRGFGPESLSACNAQAGGKVIQIVTDGPPDRFSHAGHRPGECSSTQVRDRCRKKAV